MRFLHKNKIKKTIIVISDLHLGAGTIFDGTHNILEEFHHDKELVEFIEYYNSGEYSGREVELIINGDFLDFLAVPYVKYFDDEFWSESASLEKLKIILDAHPEVMEALSKFLANKKNKVVYIIGNHDGELAFQSLQEYFKSKFPESHRDRLEILFEEDGEYVPEKGVVIKHGHEYELAHSISPESSIAEDEKGNKYFIPPWGSYYVTRLINKFKEEREYVQNVRPIRKFIINGLIYDTLFTIRFILGNFFYFFMVRFIYFFKQEIGAREVFNHLKRELLLFRSHEDISREFFEKNQDARVLIVGHTHDPIFRPYSDGTYFLNTGTWTKIFHLDFGKSNGTLLTYAQIDVKEVPPKKKRPENLDVALNIWQGISKLPFDEFS